MVLETTVKKLNHVSPIYNQHSKASLRKVVGPFKTRLDPIKLCSPFNWHAMHLRLKAKGLV